MLKAEEEEQAHMKADEEARLAEEARHKAEEHKRTRLNIGEGVRRELETIWRVEDEEQHQGFNAINCNWN